MPDTQKDFYKKLLGRTGESKAVSFLKKKKYRILKKNYVTKIGEVDIIAEQNGVIVFIEVKTRDTLFYGSVGRTDFPGGDRLDMIKSIKKLFALSGDYTVYPGHDEFTTLDRERKYNVMAEYD